MTHVELWHVLQYVQMEIYRYVNGIWYGTMLVGVGAPSDRTCMWKHTVSSLDIAGTQDFNILLYMTLNLYMFERNL